MDLNDNVDLDRPSEREREQEREYDSEDVWPRFILGRK